MAAAGQSLPKAASDDAAPAKPTIKRAKVLSTDMADDPPVVKKRVAKKKPAKKKLAKKKPIKKKPTTTTARKVAVEPAPDPSPEFTSEFYAPRDGRPPRRSAVERLNDLPPADGPLLIARVANAIERELTQIEIIVGNNRVLPRQRSEAERRARTLASLARTLAVVTQLREKNLQSVDDDADNDAMPRDLDEFRDTLARRLEGLLAEEPQTADGEPDAQ